MELTPLTAVSPIDGRYRRACASLSAYFSEGALIRYRTRVEVEYFIALCELPLPQLKDVDRGVFDSLRAVYREFSAEDAQRVKDIEKTTNHDVKAVEYLLKEKFDALGLGEYKEFIHFGLTSQDINNTGGAVVHEGGVAEGAFAFHQGGFVGVGSKGEGMEESADACPDPRAAGVAHEPGKGALRIRGPIGKAAGADCASAVFGQIRGSDGKFQRAPRGLPGNRLDRFRQPSGQRRAGVEPFTGHHPDRALRQSRGLLRRNQTDQHDFAGPGPDMWTYISMEYFKQRIVEGEVGSSTMPHKVNPIDFENSEGNLGVANAIFEHLSAKLPISRLQRDLTDSTVTRNIGVPFGHTLIGLKSLLRGMRKVLLNETALREDLEKNWAVVGEGIQTVLRREGYPEPYEALKALTRTHGKIDRDTIAKFIQSLDVSEEVKEELLEISPEKYTGIYDF